MHDSTSYIVNSRNSLVYQLNTFKLIDVELLLSVGLNFFIRKVSLYTSCKSVLAVPIIEALFQSTAWPVAKTCSATHQKPFPLRAALCSHTYVTSFLFVLPMQFAEQSLHLIMQMTLKHCNLSIFHLRLLLNNVYTVKIM